MAGIGFHIERLLGSDTYTGSLKAYLHAGMISSGNMLSTYACLLGLVTFSRVYLAEPDLVKFQVTVTSVYCLSMLLVGPLQMVLHRYLADVFYEQRPEKVLPCLRGALAMHSAAAMPVGMLFYSLSGFEGIELLAATLLLGFIVWIWICSAFLGACKAYETITAVFAISLLVTFGLAHALGQLYGFAGLLTGFALGHLMLFTLLYLQLVKEFPSRHSVRFGWLAYSNRFRMLVFASALANLGIWADKLVFWYSDGAVRVQGLLRYHPVYDPCMFIALLTAIPAYAHFLLALETHFYRLFRRFCLQLSQGLPFSQIAHTRDRMVRTLREEVTQLAKLQALCAIFVILGAPWILEMARLPSAYIHVLRLSAIGVALAVGVLLHVVLLLYFDLQREAAFVAGLFALSSGFFSALTLTLGLRFYGLGYLAAGIIALAAGAWLLDSRLSRMEYLLFRKNAMNALAELPEEQVP